MRTFCEILLTGILALGGLTVMNVETPKAQADEYCRYMCGPKETLNNFTIQISATKYTMGQSFILRATNDNTYDVRYKATVEKQYATGWEYVETDLNYQSLLPAGTNEDFDVWTWNGNNGHLNGEGTYRMKIEVTHADGKT
ncbi:hypothetical protein COD67_05120 [Bacillus cereus]|nr:hypothetical protein COI89_01550 [Bacillus cereus]PGU69269.1 hypothetical protein COD67_05120 [Bacillus cereus]